MANYEVLYRRYRPAMFKDVIGQDNVTTAIKHNVIDHTIGHAYLFSGPRGCGKTTTARILAAAINCISPPEPGEPCGECEFCSGVIRGDGGLSVHELDAASNRSIDNIRGIIETAAVGTPAQYKVFIIDEVHRLTPDASSALLKTLEEPPPNVVFILATTDPEKLLPTIRSRATGYKFRTLDPDIMTPLIEGIAEDAGIEVTEQDIANIIAEGHGSPRDTLSALERFASGASVGNSEVAQKVSKAINDNSIPGVMIALADEFGRGDLEPQQAAHEMLTFWRECLLYLEAPDLLKVHTEQFKAIETNARMLKTGKIIQLIQALSDVISKMQFNSDPRLLLEVVLIQQASPSMKQDMSAVLRRMDELERLILGGGTPKALENIPVSHEEPERAQEKPIRAPAREVEEPVVERDNKPSKSIEEPEIVDTLDADEVIDRVLDSASKRLSVRLGPAEFDLINDVLHIWTEKAPPQSMVEELETLLSEMDLSLSWKGEGAS